MGEFADMAVEEGFQAMHQYSDHGWEGEATAEAGQKYIILQVLDPAQSVEVKQNKDTVNMVDLWVV